MTSVGRSCGYWNTSILALPPGNDFCVPLDMTSAAATSFGPGAVAFSGTICGCLTEGCNSKELVPDIMTTQGSADITTRGSANVTTQGSANVTTQPSPGNTKGAEGGADQTVMSLYLLCVTGLALLR